MGDFFDKLSKSISTTSKNVKESMADSREKSNLKKQITAANTKIEQIKIIMGEKVYEAYITGGMVEDCADMCRQIDVLIAAADKCRARILAIDGIKKCDKCGVEICVDSVFCSHCGAKQEIQHFEDEAEEDEASENGDSYFNIGN